MAFRFFLTRFAVVCLVMATCSAQAATTAELLRLTDQLDQMDKLDFEQAIAKAGKCIQARDFECSEAQLKTARKFAMGNAAKDQLRNAESRQLAEKEAVEAERLALAKRQRELEEAERRLQAAEERASQQAAREAEQDSGMSTGQKIALFGSLLGQAYQNQAATRVAEAANARRFQQQLDAGKAEVARNQQRFAEERARLEAQRGRLQQESQQSRQQAQAQQAQQQQRQVVAQADTRQMQQAQQVQQAQLQREQEAAAQRAQAAQRQEADARARASAQAEQQNRAAQTLAAAANNARTPSGNAGSGGPGNSNSASSSAGSSGSAASAGQDSRIKLHGTMYVVHYASLKHSRSDKNNVTLVERVTPVQWTYDVPRVSPLQQPSGPSNAVPYQVSDLLLKQMRPKFFDYLRDKYSICEGNSTPEGCYGWNVYHQIGNSAAEVQGKLNASLRSFSTPATNDSGLDYPSSIAYSE
jgi:hypothetical protein